MDTHSLDAPTQQDAIFADADVAQFTADDTEAGRAICQMLSIMFAYTVGVMVLSTLVTIYWTSL
jgi:hypothetical protein